MVRHPCCNKGEAWAGVCRAALLADCLAAVPSKAAQPNHAPHVHAAYSARTTRVPASVLISSVEDSWSGMPCGSNAPSHPPLRVATAAAHLVDAVIVD
eukprot:365763-Chlamydomonas_euryale.AAC.22